MKIKQIEREEKQFGGVPVTELLDNSRGCYMKIAPVKLSGDWYANCVNMDSGELEFIEKTATVDHIKGHFQETPTYTRLKKDK